VWQQCLMLSTQVASRNMPAGKRCPKSPRSSQRSLLIPQAPSRLNTDKRDQMGVVGVRVSLKQTLNRENEKRNSVLLSLDFAMGLPGQASNFRGSIHILLRILVAA